MKIGINHQKEIILSNKELSILELRKEGLAMKQIADILQISDRMVRKHMKQIRKKLACRNEFQLGMKYYNDSNNKKNSDSDSDNDNNNE